MKMCSVDYCSEGVRTKGYCSRHYTSWWRTGNAILADVSIALTSNDSTKKFCTKCETRKDLEDFHVRVRNGKECIDGACKKCISTQTVDYRKVRMPAHVKRKVATNRGRALALKKYGPEGLEIRLRMEAGECCETCGDRTDRMAIDHCHASGKTRGLLCSNCNTALGLVDDNVEVLENLIKYLKTHSSAKV